MVPNVSGETEVTKHYDGQHVETEVYINSENFIRKIRQDNQMNKQRHGPSDQINGTKTLFRTKGQLRKEENDQK